MDQARADGSLAHSIVQQLAGLTPREREVVRWAEGVGQPTGNDAADRLRDKFLEVYRPDEPLLYGDDEEWWLPQNRMAKRLEACRADDTVFRYAMDYITEAQRAQFDARQAARNAHVLEARANGTLVYDAIKELSELDFMRGGGPAGEAAYQAGWARLRHELTPKELATVEWAVAQPAQNTPLDEYSPDMADEEAVRWLWNRGGPQLHPPQIHAGFTPEGEKHMHKMMSKRHRKAYSRFLQDKREKAHTPALALRRYLTETHGVDPAYVPALTDVLKQGLYPTNYRKTLARMGRGVTDRTTTAAW